MPVPLADNALVLSTLLPPAVSVAFPPLPIVNAAASLRHAE